MLCPFKSLAVGASLLALPAVADELFIEKPVSASPPTNYVNLRLGGTTSSFRVELCGELAPHWRISVEGCGSGREFLHNEPNPEIAHFRAKFTFTRLQTTLGWLEPRAALGFAEYQLGLDDGGFDFLSVNRTRTSTSGPEAGAALRWLLPVIGGFELLVEMNVSLAFFAFAPQLETPQAVVQPSASLSAGVGF